MTIKAYVSQNTTVIIIMIYYFRATCFDSLESSSGPLMNWLNTIRGFDDDSEESKHVALK